MPGLPRQFIGSFALLPPFSWTRPPPKMSEPMRRRSSYDCKSGLRRKQQRQPMGHGPASCFGWAAASGRSNRSSNPPRHPLRRAIGPTMPIGWAGCSARASTNNAARRNRKEMRPDETGQRPRHARWLRGGDAGEAPKAEPEFLSRVRRPTFQKRDSPGIKRDSPAIMQDSPWIQGDSVLVVPCAQGCDQL
jgi:hypothetical protein